jgi:molybdate transport system substrate-binding protein
MSTLIATSGVDVVGQIPDEIQKYVVFTGGISATTPSSRAAQDFLRFLTSAAVDQAIRARGLQPLR